MGQARIETNLGFYIRASQNPNKFLKHYHYIALMIQFLRIPPLDISYREPVCCRRNRFPESLQRDLRCLCGRSLWKHHALGSCAATIHPHSPLQQRFSVVTAVHWIFCEGGSWLETAFFRQHAWYNVTHMKVHGRQRDVHLAHWTHERCGHGT